MARAALHFWEEPPISGSRGSGAVFFTGCPLGCVFCQNYEISAGENQGRAFSPQGLSGLFFSLVEQGAHNINLVTPTHFLPQVRQALLVKKLAGAGGVQHLRVRAAGIFENPGGPGRYLPARL